MSFINWGHQTPEQRSINQRFELDAIYEQAVRMARAGQAPGAAGGSKLQRTPPHVAGVDFTIEFFIKAASWSNPTSHPRPYSLGTYPAPNAISIENGGHHAYWWSNETNRVDGTVSFNTTNWYHIAATRNNGLLRLYVNGSQIGSDATYNDAIPSGGNTLYIGAEPKDGGLDSLVDGKITNFRWTAKCIYTEPFTTPTAPLTALPETKLLLLATDSGHLLTDSSSHARTVTNVNSAVWDADDPFGGAGGSIKFDGTQYLTVAASTDWDL